MTALSYGFVIGMILLYMWNNTSRERRPVPKKVHLVFSAIAGVAGLSEFWGGKPAGLAAGFVAGVLGYVLSSWWFWFTAGFICAGIRFFSTPGVSPSVFHI